MWLESAKIFINKTQKIINKTVEMLRIWNVDSIDDLDAYCKQHDKGWNDCEERYKCSPDKDVKINECKKQKNNDFCSCLKTANAISGTYKELFINFAKRHFKCK